jgi:hypothetical protein
MSSLDKRIQRMASNDPLNWDEELTLQPLEDSKKPLPTAFQAETGAFRDLPDFIEAEPVAESPSTTPVASSGFISAIAASTGQSVHDSQGNASRVDLQSSLAAEDALETVNEDDIQRRRLWRKWMLTAAPSWVVSLVVHVIIILTLAMVSLDPVDKMLNILQSSVESQNSEIGEFKIDGPEIERPQEDAEPIPVAPTTQTAKIDTSQIQPPTIANLQSTIDTANLDPLSDRLINRQLLANSMTKSMSTMLNSRSASSKSEMLEKFGGSSESEKAVALALKWIANHQIKRGPKTGAWSFNHSLGMQRPTPSTGQGQMGTATNAATALAILPFLGAGQTHTEGTYKETVKMGLASLISNMKLGQDNGLPNGSWHEPGGRMYSHGLATICICEAYAMTKDPDLLQPAQLALNYLITSQDPRGGGWRYEPREPGDTSVVGWCLMGLKSGRMGNLSVPQVSFTKSNDFLNLMSTDNGAYYGYDRPKAEKDHTMTAVGLLCRMYLGWPKENPGMEQGVKYLDEVGPLMDNLYYTYYATQVMRHYGGETWERWNSRLRDPLISLQLKESNDAGSWDPVGHHVREGGRLYQTALGTMILEVYYRHLPLYSSKSMEDKFEI